MQSISPPFAINQSIINSSRNQSSKQEATTFSTKWSTNHKNHVTHLTINEPFNTLGWSNYSTTQVMNHAINQPSNQAIMQSTSQVINQPCNQPTSEPTSPLTYHQWPQNHFKSIPIVFHFWRDSISQCRHHPWLLFITYCLLCLYCHRQYTIPLIVVYKQWLCLQSSITSFVCIGYQFSTIDADYNGLHTLLMWVTEKHALDIF